MRSPRKRDGQEPKSNQSQLLETPMLMDNNDQPCAHIRCYGRNFTQDATFELIPLMSKTLESYLASQLNEFH